MHHRDFQLADQFKNFISDEMGKSKMEMLGKVVATLQCFFT